MPRRLSLALGLLLAAAACSRTTGVNDTAAHRVVQVNQEFPLAVGQIAVLDDTVMGAPFRVTLTAVTNDSRCPENARCVWEGDARLALRLQSGAATADTAAHTTQRFTPDPDLAGFGVTVVFLAPHTNTSRTIEQKDYVATLKITRR